MKLIQEKTHDQQNTKILNKNRISINDVSFASSSSMAVWQPTQGPTNRLVHPRVAKLQPQTGLYTALWVHLRLTKQKQVTNACRGRPLSPTKGQTVFRKSSIYGETKTMKWSHDYKIRIVVTWGQVHRTLNSTEVTSTELKNEVFSCWCSRHEALIWLFESLR